MISGKFFFFKLPMLGYTVQARLNGWMRVLNYEIGEWEYGILKLVKLMFVVDIDLLAKREKVLVDVISYADAWQQTWLGSELISKGLPCLFWEWYMLIGMIISKGIANCMSILAKTVYGLIPINYKILWQYFLSIALVVVLLVLIWVLTPKS